MGWMGNKVGIHASNRSQFVSLGFRYIVGIDPDVDRNGMALLDVRSRALSIELLPFPYLIDRLCALNEMARGEGQNLLVVMEAGYLNKGNWHLSPRDSKAVAAAKGRNAGMNHQTGILIAEMCRHNGIIIQEAKPLPKMWSGANRKITQDELRYIVGDVKRTNQEGRDAALLAWVHAGLPLKMLNR